MFWWPVFEADPQQDLNTLVDTDPCRSRLVPAYYTGFYNLCGVHPFEVAARGVGTLRGMEMPVQQIPPAKMHVLIPLDKNAGDVIEVMSPGGKVVSVMIPPGARPGQTIEVSNPDVQAIVTAQPGAPLLEGEANATDIQNKVHGLLRDGKWQIVKLEDALAYSRTLTPYQSNTSNPKLLGCHKCRPVARGCPGFYTFNVACSDNCLCCLYTCFPFCCLSLLQLSFIVIFSGCGERDDNTYIHRGEYGNIESQTIVVDHERGTLAVYEPKCGSPQLNEVIRVIACTSLRFSP